MNAQLHVGRIVQTGIRYIEVDRCLCTERTVNDQFRIQEVHLLYHCGVTAVGKVLYHLSEVFLQVTPKCLIFRLAEESRCQIGTEGKCSRFHTDFNDLALLYDDHTLAVCHDDRRTVGDHVFFPLGVSGTPRLVLTCHHQHLVRKSILIEELFPLITELISTCL